MRTYTEKERKEPHTRRKENYQTKTRQDGRSSLSCTNPLRIGSQSFDSVDFTKILQYDFHVSTLPFVNKYTYNGIQHLHRSFVSYGNFRY